MNITVYISLQIFLSISIELLVLSFLHLILSLDTITYQLIFSGTFITFFVLSPYFSSWYRGCEPYILKLESVTVLATGKDKENKIFKLVTYNSLQVSPIFTISIIFFFFILQFLSFCYRLFSSSFLISLIFVKYFFLYLVHFIIFM